MSGGDFLVFAESLADGGHLATSDADARKGAYTNAFKKAAAFFGVGRQAYEGTLDDDNLPGDHVPEAAESNPAPAVIVPTAPPRLAPTRVDSPAPPRSIPPPPPPPRTRLSSKQLSAIWAIGRKLGFDQQSLRQHIKTTFGVQPEFLSRDQASQAIGALSQQAGNGHADEFPEREIGQEG